MLPDFAIVDLDGTLTDPQKSRASFEAHYLAGVAELLQLPIAEVRASVGMYEQRLRPEVDAWVREGHAVSSAGSDQYLRCTYGVLQLVAERVQGIPAEYDAALHTLFRQSYARAELVFRDDIDDLVAWALTHPAAIVTNSDPLAVREKLCQLTRGRELGSRVYGHAQKYVITPDELSWLPESMAVPGLSREVLVRRGHYFRVVQQARGLPDAQDMNGVVVIGDNLELDLMLPLMLGAWVILMAHDYTPLHEQDFVRSHPRGSVVASLREALAIVRGYGHS